MKPSHFVLQSETGVHLSGDEVPTFHHDIRKQAMPMKVFQLWFLSSCIAVLLASPALAQETRRIVFLAGRPSHGYGAHEHLAGCRLLADAIQRSSGGGVQCEVYDNGWPQDESVLNNADSVVMYCDGGGGHPALAHLPKLAELMQAGVGFACLHYAVEVPPDRGGAEFLEWLGGYFETHWSVNPHWVADYTALPNHEVTRGVKPFRANDEWYFHMRFRPNMEGVTPILSAVPPEDTMRRPDGPHSGNPTVRKAVAHRLPQHTAWIFERPNGGRSFGFTGGHFHWNWGREEILKLVCNAICWTAKSPVPEGGLPVLRPSIDRLEKGQDYPIPKDFNREKIQEEFDLSGGAIQLEPAEKLELDGPAPRHPKNAVAGVWVHSDLKATLSASEPFLLSPTCLDIDHRGRLWVCEVQNYRGHQGKRPEGDRILILEDDDGDGVMDRGRVFYQGSDIDSAMGICVLGKRIIVSASPNIWVFTDEDGDDIPDNKELLFSRTGKAQHDHSAHSFLFGPDGKLYWNFGNTGKSVHDRHGNPVRDMAGNLVVDSGKPYYGGMVFRCNLDGSQLETLAHNFRNNYEVCVDAFGGLWQSDNDDDGNKAARVNFVMEYGNYGYLDELTGAGWRVPRANLEQTIPQQHWHLNDPGVVPTMLITGAGSPSGITVYEGQLLPSPFRDQLIHCEPGQGVLRAYLVSASAAGYSASVENMMRAAGDDWFRPVDVATAPDGSLFVADWYDPGVGGHQMGDLDRGRIFRLAPNQVAYQLPELDLQTPAGAAAGLFSPNQATRFVAWQALEGFGKRSQAALEPWTSHENPRVRARAYWALGKIGGSGKNVVAAALSDSDSDVRCMAIRLARQLGLAPADYFVKVLSDPSAAVRRELAVALRLDRSPEMPGLWAALASQQDGSDRWSIEALGIGAELRWDECFAAYLKRTEERQQTPNPELVWRARTELAAPYLIAMLTQSSDPGFQSMEKLLRSLDYHSPESRNSVLSAVTEQLIRAPEISDVQTRLLAETLARLPDAKKYSNSPHVQRSVSWTLQSSELRRLQLSLLSNLDPPDSVDHLIDLACQGNPDAVAVDSAKLILQRLSPGDLHSRFGKLPEERAAQLTAVIASTATQRDLVHLTTLLADPRMPASVRVAASKGIARSPRGAKELLRMAEDGSLPRETTLIVGSMLAASDDQEIRKRAAVALPVPRSKASEAFPEISRLVSMRGNAEKGAQIYRTTGTCVRCHPLDNSVRNIGPDLSEIGSKLAREALWISIMDPSAGISHNYESYTALTESGQAITGLKISQTETQWILRDAEGIDHALETATLESVNRQNISLMPANLVEQLTVEEMADLVEYLVTLRK